MKIEVADNITEGTEFEIRVNGRCVHTAVAEYDDDAEDTANRFGLVFYAQSLKKPITITANAL